MHPAAVAPSRSDTPCVSNAMHATSGYPITRLNGGSESMMRLP